jgi:hypothetical protein
MIRNMYGMIMAIRWISDRVHAGRSHNSLDCKGFRTGSLPARPPAAVPSCPLRGLCSELYGALTLAVGQ